MANNSKRVEISITIHFLGVVTTQPALLKMSAWLIATMRHRAIVDPNI
jgi:hypothetical protein